VSGTGEVTYPRLLGCNTCGGMKRAEVAAEEHQWADEHGVVHRAVGEHFSYREHVMPTGLAPMIDLGGGMLVYQHDDEDEDEDEDDEYEGP
jgi:hypothetical protein